MTLRHLGSILLLLTGVLHLVVVYLYGVWGDTVPLVIFGVVYLAIGILTFSSKGRTGDFISIVFLVIGSMVLFTFLGNSRVPNWATLGMIVGNLVIAVVFVFVIRYRHAYE